MICFLENEKDLSVVAMIKYFTYFINKNCSCEFYITCIKEYFKMDSKFLMNNRVISLKIDIDELHMKMDQLQESYRKFSDDQISFREELFNNVLEIKNKINNDFIEKLNEILPYVKISKIYVSGAAIPIKSLSSFDEYTNIAEFITGDGNILMIDIEQIAAIELKERKRKEIREVIVNEQNINPRDKHQKKKGTQQIWMNNDIDFKKRNY